MRISLFQIHKLFALIFSVPLLIMAITGAILSFAPKENKVMHGDPKTSLASTLRKIKDAYPDSQFMRAQYTPQLLTLMIRKEEVTLLKWDRVHDVFMSETDPKDDPFVFSKIIHESLLLQKIGKKIVGIGGLGLLVILLSGTFFWIKPELSTQLKNLFKFRNLKKLKEFHIILGMVVFLPLLFTAVSGFLIEFNGVFFSDKAQSLHTPPTSCSWNEQVSALEKASLPARGMIQFCRPDFYYLSLSDQTGSRQLTPSGQEVLFVPKNNWQNYPGHRKHYFVHWHGGENFGALESPYLYFTSSSLFLLIGSGLVLWLRKKKIFRRKL